MSECQEEASSDNGIQRYIDNTADDRPFYVADLSDIVKKYRYWRSKLPRIEVFYAVKCNPDPTVLRLMVALGIGFDCSSKDELKLMISAGAPGGDIVYGHPFKSISSLLYSKSAGVDLMTFDSDQELIKIQRVFPNARLVIRMNAFNQETGFCLNDKFGCGLKEAVDLLKMAKHLDLNVVGVSFHVGTLCQEPLTYAKAIGMARQVFDTAESIGFHLTLLDIGGGFPGASGTCHLFDKMCYVINQSLEEHFPEGCGIRIIAEPGCYMVCSAFTLYTTVIGKRMVYAEQDTERHDNLAQRSGDSKKILHYYLNESIFGSYSTALTQHHWFLGFHARPVLSKRELSSRQLLDSKLWGATCANFDCIYEDCTLPELEVGDVLAFENMGAYSLSLATNFNGFPKIEIYYTCSQQDLTSEKLKSFAEFCQEIGSTRLKFEFSNEKTVLNSSPKKIEKIMEK